MNITIQGLGIELTEAIKQHAEERMQALEKFVHTKNPEAVTVEVEVGKESEHHNKGPIFFCEVHMIIPDEGPVRSREVHEDLYAAIDVVRKELQRQLVDLKEKMIDKRQQG
ncbi:MAG: ribosome-associated translation inhibitor RaiA [Candidatus Levybacteria bacterium]|nr:ribosome-associated translation inhibitor RaiA [Candidatus Levybacteria bacterium]